MIRYGTVRQGVVRYEIAFLYLLTNVPLCPQNPLLLKFELQNLVRLYLQTRWTNEDAPLDLLVFHWMEHSISLDCSSFRPTEIHHYLYVYYTSPRD